MAIIENSAIERKGRSFSHGKKQMLRIDMTPMVDLGFLLITFFVFTTAISGPTATDLYMPKDGDPSKLQDDLALTLILIENNEVYYYHGNFDDAVRSNDVFKTNYSTYDGIGKIIRQKQKDIEASGKFNGGRKEMMIIVKPTSSAVYKNVVDALDEILINDVRKYAIVEAGNEEINFLKAKSGF